MVSVSAGGLSSELRGWMGLALVVGAGFAMGILTLQRASRTGIHADVAVYVVTPLIVNAALVVAGIFLWRRRFQGTAMLRVGGWVFVGMAVFGLFITWILTHEALRGEPIANGFYLTVSSTSLGGFVGLVLGWLDAQSYLQARQLEREQKRLEEQVSQLEEFASIVSHDLRNPLNVATLTLEDLRSSQRAGGQGAQADTDQLEGSLDDLDHALSRMERIVEDVLTLARESQTTVERECISLETIARHCWGNVDTDAAALAVEDDVTFRADRSKLEHVFENLFRNALEHGLPAEARDQKTSDEPTGETHSTSDAIESGPPRSDGGAELLVRVGPLANGFYVEDTGPGLPDVPDEQLFEPGYTTSETGTGFGLRVVQKMVVAHDWELGTARQGTSGARFEITGVELVECEPERTDWFTQVE